VNSQDGPMKIWKPNLLINFLPTFTVTSKKYNAKITTIEVKNIYVKIKQNKCNRV